MTLVERARAAAPALAAQNAANDDLGHLTEETWRILGEVGITRALQPARWGGGEVRLNEFAEAVIELSAASPSAGWVAGVIGVHPWQLALFDERAQDEMWGPDPARPHSSSYNPTGTARRVEGGYVVSGRWSFSSGCDLCTAVNLGAIVRSEDGVPAEIPEYRSFLLETDQYVIEDNWNVAGLKGTGSKDIVVEPTFVPEYRSQSHVDYALGLPLAGQERNDGPLYRLPWSVVFNLALAASVLGSARGYVDMWTAETRNRVLPPNIRLADDPITQTRLAEATWTLKAATDRVRSIAAELMARAEAGDAPTMAERGHYRWEMNRGVDLVGEMIAGLHRSATGRVIFKDHPLHVRFQDIQGGLGHAFLVPDALAKAAGGDVLGTSTPELVL